MYSAGVIKAGRDGARGRVKTIIHSMVETVSTFRANVLVLATKGVSKVARDCMPLLRVESHGASCEGTAGFAMVIKKEPFRED